MKHAGAAALDRAQSLLKDIRKREGLKEKTRGNFYRASRAFLHFHDEQGLLSVDLKKAGGMGFERYPLDTPAQQRKLVDDAKRRAAKLDED